jgi:AcrR family transcriptional regulator
LDDDHVLESDSIVKFDGIVTQESTHVRRARAVRKPASAAPDRRERRKRATRQALLDSANSLLASRSLDSLSVDEIAMRADVGKGTFYNYFDDKDALARELASSIRAQVESEIAIANQAVQDPAERIARAFCCALRFGLKSPKQARATMRLFPHYLDPSAPLNSGVRRDVAEGLARRRIVAPSLDVGVAYVVGVFMAGVNRALDLSSSEAKTFGHDLGRILLHGLGIGRAEARRIMVQATQALLH